MKSKGKDLDAAFGQAMDYVRALPDQSTLPRAIVVSDFQTFRFYDLTKDAQLTTFKLADLRNALDEDDDAALEALSRAVPTYTVTPNA